MIRTHVYPQPKKAFRFWWALIEASSMPHLQRISHQLEALTARMLAVRLRLKCWHFSNHQHLLSIVGYANGTDTVLHSCFDILSAEAVCLSLRYSLCQVRNEQTTNEAKNWHPFVRNIPGYRVILSPSSSLGYILPRIPVICRGNNHFFEDKHARTLFCTAERQHTWFRCRSFWICWLGCNFHGNACLAVCATWSLDLLTIQVYSFPKDEPMLVLADAAAIKVRNF
jgi:hypothetical protein